MPFSSQYQTQTSVLKLSCTLTTPSTQQPSPCKDLTLDKTDEMKKKTLSGALEITKETDYIFPATTAGPGTVVLSSPGRRLALTFSASMRLSGQENEKSQPVPCDVVVWNPWTDKAKRMPDFGDDEYKNMICIEPGCVHAPVSLPSGACFSLTQKIELLD